MKRRNFIQNSLALAASTLVVNSSFASTRKYAPAGEKTFNINYAPHDGMFANHAGKDFVEQIKFMH